MMLQVRQDCENASIIILTGIVAAKLKLGKDVGYIAFNGSRREVHISSDPSVGAALGHELENLTFTGG